MAYVGVLSGPSLAGDRVDTLIQQLLTDSSEKVRLQAAVALGNIKDVRGVPALTQALTDGFATVRSVAAVALGRDDFVAKASARVRNDAIVMLKMSSEQDPDPSVKQRSAASYDKLLPLYTPESAPPLPEAPGGGTSVVTTQRRGRSWVAPTIVAAVAALAGGIAMYLLLHEPRRTAQNVARTW